MSNQIKLSSYNKSTKEKQKIGQVLDLEKKYFDILWDLFTSEKFLNDLEEKWDDHHQRITEKKVQVFYPTSDDVWTKKTVSRYSFIETDGKSLPMTCTRYTYPDYETAIKEAAKDNHIFEPLYREYPHPLIYSVPDWMDSLQNRRIDVTYEISQSDDFPECEPSAYLSVSHPYHRGSVFFAQSLDWKNTERESIYLHIYLMHETSNVRTYTTREGVEFTLVDDDVPVDQIEGLVATIGIPSNFKDTMVVFTRGDEVISMHFSNLSDEEIGEILELINMNGV